MKSQWFWNLRRIASSKNMVWKKLEILCRLILCLLANPSENLLHIILSIFKKIMKYTNINGAFHVLYLYIFDIK